jgi:hypothetical protein
MHLKAIAIKEELLGADDYEVGLSIGHLASLYNYHMKKHKKAEKLYLRSIAISEYCTCFSVEQLTDDDALHHCNLSDVHSAWSGLTVFEESILCGFCVIGCMLCRRRCKTLEVCLLNIVSIIELQCHGYK